MSRRRTRQRKLAARFGRPLTWWEQMRRVFAQMAERIRPLVVAFSRVAQLEQRRRRDQFALSGPADGSGPC